MLLFRILSNKGNEKSLRIPIEYSKNSNRLIRPATCRNHPISTEPIPVYRVANDPRTRNPPSPENRSEFPERTFRCFAD